MAPRLLGMVCKTQCAERCLGDTTFMKQISLATTGFELVTKRTRKRVFLDETNLVVP